MILKTNMKVQEIKNKNMDENTSSKNINENNAYRITERLAFPRLIGSEGEKKAREIVVDEFTKAGYNPIHRDEFRTSFHTWIFTRYIFLIIGSVLLFLALSVYINPYLTLAVFVLYWLQLC